MGEEQSEYIWEMRMKVLDQNMCDFYDQKHSVHHSKMNPEEQ
jgi:hypothetical protein